MLDFSKIVRVTFTRIILFLGLAFIFLVVAYVISIGPVWAYLLAPQGPLSQETRYQIMSYYSPLYVPCGNDPISLMFIQYISFWIKIAAYF